MEKFGQLLAGAEDGMGWGFSNRHPEVQGVGYKARKSFINYEPFKSLIQIIGRAARNINSNVILYADCITDSIKKALTETERRRQLQLDYNKIHQIIPTTIMKPIREKEVDLKDTKHIPKKNIPKLIREAEKEMRMAADILDFERAIFLRDRIKELEKRINS